MLVEQVGDLFTTTQPALGHGVNVVGVMGAGVAALVRKRWPEMYAEYRERCHDGELVPGSVLPWIDPESGRWVLNLATQDQPGRNAHLGWVEEALLCAVEGLARYEVSGLAIPRLGCGIGGLSWDQVRPVVEQISNAHPQVVVEVWSLPASS